jgi:hypothetical protein
MYTMPKRRDAKNPFDEFVSGEDFGTEVKSAEQGEADFGVTAAVESIPVDQVFPDVYQSRHPILPSGIRERFWDGEIDCFQAAREWLEMAKDHPAYQARIDELLHMGQSFQTEGQVNAITGRWAVMEDNRFVFIIETGERRYWATILAAVVEGFTEPPRINVIGYETTSRKRQVLENRHQSPPGAVSQAREIAMLLLDAMGIASPIDRPKDIYDYFRRALTYRVPQEMWDELQAVTGLTDRRMKQVLSLLKLPSYLLDWADVYDLPSRQLREIIRAPESQWEHLIQEAIAEKVNLESELLPSVRADQQVKQRKQKSGGRRDPVKIALGGIRRFRNAVYSAKEEKKQTAMIGQLATDIVVDEQKEAGNTVLFLEQLAGEIRVRLDNL